MLLHSLMVCYSLSTLLFDVFFFQNYFRNVFLRYLFFLFKCFYLFFCSLFEVYLLILSWYHQSLYFCTLQKSAFEKLYLLYLYIFATYCCNFCNTTSSCCLSFSFKLLETIFIINVCHVFVESIYIYIYIY